jgi:hypothetical protein
VVETMFLPLDIVLNLSMVVGVWNCCSYSFLQNVKKEYHIH